MNYIKRFLEVSYENKIFESFIDESKIISGKEFSEKYIKFHDGKLVKVIYKKGLKLGSNLGNGEYWCVTPDCLDTYLGNTRDSQEYKKFVKGEICKKLDKDLRIYVEEGISDEIDENPKIVKKIQKYADGIYDPEYDDYGLVLFRD